MTDDNFYIEHSAAARQMQQFCDATAEQMGLELAGVSWSHDLVEAIHWLTLTTTTGSETTVGTTSAEIWAYPTEETQAKMRQQIAALVERVGPLPAAGPL